MVRTDDWLPVFDAWARQPVPRVDRRLVHKAHPGNVLVARVEAQGPDEAAVQLAIPTDHPFFFEHPVDHVPGLAMIEAGRQVGLLLAHTLYDVPLDGFAFFIDGLQARFQRPAELDAPVFGRCILSEVERRRGRLVGMHCTGHYLQSGEPIGTLEGRWRILPDAVARRLRRR